MMINDSVILINKPIGMTSFKVTASVRHKTGIKKAGHAGTLDPLASGVLPIMTGKATRLIDLIPDGNKRYIAEFMLGLTTDTLDSEGEIQTEQPVLCSKEDIVAAVASFVGDIEQIPPMYSALKKDGMKLYDLARLGKTVERSPRKVTISSIELTELIEKNDTFVVKIDVVCSKGTYIRTLIDDIGMALHCGAIMTGLMRVESNGFAIDDCITLEEFMRADDFEKYMHSPDFAVQKLSKISVTPAQATRFLNGGQLDIARITNNNELKTAALSEKSPLFRIYSDSRFLGLGTVKNNELCPKTVF